MSEFVIKSILSLTILYLIYFFLLRNTKAYQFNRFYLLFALIFSITIPFLQIKTNINSPIYQTIQDTSSSISEFQVQSNFVLEENNRIINRHNLFLLFYLLISGILIIRFFSNLYKITGTIKNSEKLSCNKPKIVLASEKTLPYSFFNYIIVNKTEYETEKIEKELIIHEETHCKQYHTVDILLIEIAKFVLWFNPVLWILKKEIQLVHEYIADSEVLQNQNVKTYQNVLLNLVFRNNSTYLASNFNYSLTKKRLLMMTKNNSNKKSTIRKIIVVPLVFVLAITLTFSQNNKSTEASLNNENEWWYPILKKHNIELLAFNNFDGIFEMGISNSINNGIVTLTDALIIIREDDSYKIIKSPLAYHDLSKNEISAGEGTMEIYSFESDDSKPNNKLFFKNFIFKKSNGKKLLKVENVKGTVY